VKIKLKKYKMEKYYLTLADGRKVRVLLNDYVISEFERLTGLDFTILADGKPRVPEAQCLTWLVITEGEKADCKDLGLTQNELVPLFDMPAATEFNKIMVKIAYSQN
jgi:hypothetical protein